MEEHLYTVKIDVFKTLEVFIDQLRTTATTSDTILTAWVEKAVEQGFIKGTKDPAVALQDIIENENELGKLEGFLNVWRIDFLIREGLYTYSSFESDVYDAHLHKLFDKRKELLCTIDFIKTSTEISTAVLTSESVMDAATTRALRQAEDKYEAYKERHEALKGSANMTREVRKDRKQVEKQLLHWQAKKKFLQQGYNRDGTATKKNTYTITFDYECYHRAGVWTYQLHLRGHDISFVFHSWASKIMYDKWGPKGGGKNDTQILNNRDRVLLMEKVSQGIYAPVPIGAYTNVWGTYFSLSAGLVKLTIVKTALDDAVKVLWSRVV